MSASIDSDPVKVKQDSPEHEKTRVQEERNSLGALRATVSLCLCVRSVFRASHSETQRHGGTEEIGFPSQPYIGISVTPSMTPSFSSARGRGGWPMPSSV